MLLREIAVVFLANYLDNAYASPYGEEGWRLVVYLDVLSDSGEIVVLEQHTPDVLIDEIRLETKPAGEYTAFCGLSPADCEPEAAQHIRMPSDGIFLVVIEASASLIYCDPALNMFVRHWLGD